MAKIRKSSWSFNTILKILVPSDIIPAPPPPPTNINVEVVAHSQANTSRATLQLGEGVNLKSHPFYSRIYNLMTKRQIQANSDCPEHNGTDIHRPVCVQVGILICLPKVAKMVCRGSKHDAVFLLSAYTMLK